MKKIVYIILALQIAACTPKTNADIQKFDLAAFKKHPQYTEGDTLVSLSDKKEYYLEERRALGDSLVVHQNAYYKNTLTLKCSANMIINKDGLILLGVQKNYDQYGNLEKKYSHSRGFKYSVVDLVKKLKSAYNMQIDTTERTYHISRDYENKVYEVNYYKISEYGNRIPYQMIFDGTTGKFLREGAMNLAD